MIDQHDQKVLLSIDWDFFIWGLAEALRAHLPEPAGAQGRGSAWTQLEADLRLGEEFPAAIADQTWSRRREVFRSWNVRAEEEVNILPDRDCVVPGEFVDVLAARFGRPAAPTWVADSHGRAFRAAQMACVASGRSLKVVHFDAHCDLGYETSDVAGQVAHDQLDCGSWLYHVLRTGLAQNVDVVYPDWRGLSEWERYGTRPHLDAFHQRIRVFTWSQWRALAERHEAILWFVARSSPWTPPWTDEAFLSFVSGLGPYVCLDCREPSHSAGYDACKPRAWATNVPS